MNFSIVWNCNWFNIANINFYVMLFFAYFSSCIHLFHFSAPSTTGSDDDIPTDNCIHMMKFMTNHPNQSWDPTHTSIAVIHDGASFVRIALLAQNETSWYQIREMEAGGCPEILSAQKCNDETANEYLALSIIINKYFTSVFQKNAWCVWYPWTNNCTPTKIQHCRMPSQFE